MSEPSSLRQLTTSTTPFRERIPPSSAGMRSDGISSMLAGGACMPGTSGTRPVMLATAHISMADAVPSWKELYFSGFRIDLGTSSGG